MKRDTKNQLLEKGLEIITCKGFNNTGIQEVLDAVGAPKGSFYHFFKSKQDFGLQMIDYHAAQSREHINSFLNDESHPPLERLKRFFQSTQAAMEAADFSGGCLMGNMSQEMGDLNAAFEKKLERKWQASRAAFADCLIAARRDGAIKGDFDPDDTADFMLNSWQGAMIRMKVTRSSEPLELFQKMIFEHLLK
ncbi:TetR/AcrR family transcriptional regulator [Acanthopleuribacter pedis]|uniref:TetR family transcriptional regulator C-terminal domain-containing protein n=1 Tax=Acanthopleuribacter pedis TaxID=442870 RepID=A0A8J7U3X8_9BACT|nr:TetR/AcrR family transcriptional regulator [Acanthopleuribacter pedis]MBO1318778.1 TetR family transcriptional regulator C-terminal domain-containing protein [Acanthopleuribacter pedis]